MDYMKLIATGLMFAAFSAIAGTTLQQTVEEYAATMEWRMLPRDFLCFQPGIVSLAVRTIEWQRLRIEELERQLAERK